MKKGCNVQENPSQEVMAVLIAVAEEVLAKSVKRRRRARKVL